MSNQTEAKGPRPVRALFALSLFSCLVYAGAIAVFTPDGKVPNAAVLGALGVVYLASLYSLSVFVRGEAKASKEAMHLRQIVEQLPQDEEVVRRNNGRTLVVRTRPGRVRSYGFTLARDEELTEDNEVELTHYSLLRTPFHMVDTWRGPCVINSEGEIAEVKGKAGPTRRSVWWATPGSITFADREQIAELIDVLGHEETGS